MYKLVGVILKDSKTIRYCDPLGQHFKKNDKVIVEMENYIAFGIVNTIEKEFKDEDVVFPLNKVVRIANKEDVKKNNENIKEEEKALSKAITIAKQLDLPMRFISASFSFNREQLFIRYASADRVDFRELAKKLAQVFKTRIELRQVGIRDKAKIIGGLGPCGRVLCCNSFLEEFESVSINMAKNQFLSLNPTKINGQCGRLLCCLNYEDDIYTELKKELPAIGNIVNIDGRSGKVVEVNILNNTYKVEFNDNTSIIMENDKNS